MAKHKTGDAKRRAKAKIERKAYLARKAHRARIQLALDKILPYVAKDTPEEEIRSALEQLAGPPNV